MSQIGQNIGHVRADKPPSKHAMQMLRWISHKPQPAQEINFTVRDKLLQFGYVEMIEMPSPYSTHRAGRLVHFLRITATGSSALELRP